MCPMIVLYVVVYADTDLGRNIEGGTFYRRLASYLSEYNVYFDTFYLSGNETKLS